MLTKVDALGHALEGAVFDIRDASDYLIQSGLTSDSNGVVSAENLAPGSYRFIEVEAPAGYLLNTTDVMTFDISSASAGKPGQVDAGKLVNYKADVHMQKVDPQGQPLSGAHFDLMDTSGNTLLKGIQSDKSGQVSISDLSPGDYLLIEVSAPEGYLINTQSIEFTVSSAADGEPDTLVLDDFVNYQSEAVLVKTDARGAVLEGAVFSLEDSSGSVIQTGLTSNEAGEVYVSDLSPGSYNLVETESVDGYILDDSPISFAVGDGMEGQPELIELGDWINYKGSFELTKTDGSNQVVPHAVFELYDQENQLVLGELITDSSGKILVEDLAPGDYYLIETQAPEGYQLDSTPIELSIPVTFRGKPERIAVQAINEILVQEEPNTPDNDEPSEESSQGSDDGSTPDRPSSETPSSEDGTSSGALPQTNVVSFASIIRILGLLLLVFGLLLLSRSRHQQKDDGTAF
ncbi:Collagen adhesion protein [Alkalibacterium sp. AK22]|nr:Collagen adhesion protein [Alkalibacterium sp. AK22]